MELKNIIGDKEKLPTVKNVNSSIRSLFNFEAKSKVNW